MNLLSRLFTPFARKASPALPLNLRRIDGAASGRRGAGMGTFGPINGEVAAAGPQVRRRARYLAANNPFIVNGVANWVGALIGAGIEASGDAASTAAFNAWADQADADGLSDWRGLQATAARAMVVDGEAFFQIVDGPGDLPQLRAIPADLVDESISRPLPGGGWITSGVEFNASGRRVAFHVMPNHPNDIFGTSDQAIRVPASEILHLFRPIAPGQVRGLSWLAPIVLPASELDQLLDALLLGTKVAAMFAGFVVNTNDTGAGGDPFDGEAQPSLEPGTLQRLPGGWDIKFATPAHANETASFVRAQLQQLAAGLGLPEHLLSGDLTGANYSSLRAGLLPFRGRVEQIQYHTFAPQLLNPVWREVIAAAAAAGQIAAFEDDTAKFLRVEWLPPAFMQVDPLKQVEADVAEMNAGLTSRRKLVGARGWRIEDLDAEIAADTFTPRIPAPVKPKDSANAT